MKALRSGAAILLAAIFVLGLAFGSRLLSLADRADAPSDAPSEAPVSVVSDPSDVSDTSDVSDVSDISDLTPSGDVNSDGDVNMKDVLALRRFIAQLPVFVDEANADVYTDGELTMKDVLLLRKFIAQWDVRFGPPPSEVSEEPEEELRAVWVTYYEVAGLMKWSEDATRDAIDTMLDNCAERGANTVIYHVRAYSDAYYDSAVFPPHRSVAHLIEDGFDPLTYAVSAAHDRGMKLHAWINPYRIGTSTDNARCDDYFEYNSRFYYNPASETARALILDGIRELTENYDVDGIHFDDYFYPDGISDQPQPFDTGYTDGDLAAWRREQVNALIRDAHALVHELKEDVAFGVAPAANLINNLTRLYADVPTWMAEGWLDYVCPQVYYGFQNAGQPFDQCVAQWCELPRADGVRIYVGLALYKAGLREDTWGGAGGKTEWVDSGGDILARQVRFLRGREDVDGFALFSYSYLLEALFNDSDNDLGIAALEMQNLLAEIRS